MRFFHQFQSHRRDADMRALCSVTLLTTALFFSTPLAAQEATVPLDLDRWLLLKPDLRPPLEESAFARSPVTRANCDAAGKKLWHDYCKTARPALQAEWESKVLRLDSHKMKFAYRTFGTRPAKGWDLYLSFHGGGGTSTAVNESQWQNQIKLYTPKQGVYVAPRAPTDSWNMWHQKHMDIFLARLIEGAVVCMGVNPNRVYIMGYSAGGDGVYQLAPRIADRLAAAAMMAGHPNETSPLGLRNIGFTIHVGENDSGYNRNKVAAEWKTALAALHSADPKGYIHKVVIHKGMGHWMNRTDAVALEWMAGFTRDPLPAKIVWRQDDVTHSQFYWLALPQEEIKDDTEITAELQGQHIVLSKISGIKKVTILLNDQMLDLDQPVTILCDGKTLFTGVVPRTLATLSRSLERRHDPNLLFCAEISVDI